MSLRDMILGKRSESDAYSALTNAHRDRQKLFDTYWNYYRGHHAKPLKVRPGTTDDNVILNLCKRAVNKGVQYLFGEEVTFEVDSQGDDRTPEEQYLDMVWGKAEQKQTLLQSIALNGFVTGTPIVRLYEPEPGARDGLPRIVNINPALVDIITADDDIEDVREYDIVWKSGQEWKRHRIVAQPNGMWETIEQVRGANNTWQIVTETAWPHPYAPIGHAQNLPMPNELWGVSDLEEADMNDAINFAASNINRILKFHAHPKTIGSGFNAAQLQSTAVDEFWTIPNDTAKVYNLEMQSDLGSAFAYLNLLKATWAKVTSVPELDPAQVNVGALSGFALRILYGDLLEVTRVKRNTYGGLLSELNRRLLDLGGVAAYGTMDVANVWGDPLPVGETEQAQVLEIDRRNGLSQETYLERRGYDVERELERAQAEQQARATIGEEVLRAFEAGQGGAANNMQRGFGAQEAQQNGQV